LKQPSKKGDRSKKAAKKQHGPPPPRFSVELKSPDEPGESGHQVLRRFIESEPSSPRSGVEGPPPPQHGMEEPPPPRPSMEEAPPPRHGMER
jgi:hypothetical protein